MRKNTVDAFKAWQAGRKFRAGGAAVWTDGVDVYSYGTRIIHVKGNDVLFNVQRYSTTTSNHQNSLRVLMAQNGINFQTYEPDNS